MKNNNSLPEERRKLHLKRCYTCPHRLAETITIVPAGLKQQRVTTKIRCLMVESGEAWLNPKSGTDHTTCSRLHNASRREERNLERAHASASQN